jgi:hypothetical protein
MRVNHRRVDASIGTEGEVEGKSEGKKVRRRSKIDSLRKEIRSGTGGEK